MGGETEFLKWKNLMNDFDFYKNADKRDYTQEKKMREKNIKELDEHEDYMKEQGFTFKDRTLTFPSGEIYERT